jgi:hypothetical protein
MGYCDGGDLASTIEGAKGQRFEESKILHWFVQVHAASLAFLVAKHEAFINKHLFETQA